MRDDLFSDHWFSYVVKADAFTQAAIRLEEIANFGDDNWIIEMKKHNLKPGEPFKLTPISPEFISATRDRSCRDISIYLFAISLELLLKAVLLIHSKKHEDIITHKVSKLFKEAENIINVTSFNIGELETLLSKVDEILIWAGRYPMPSRKNKSAKEDIEKLARIDGGYTSHIPTAIDANMLKAIHKHVFKYISQYIRPLAITPETS